MINIIENVYNKPVLYRKKLIIKRKNSYFCSIFLAKIEKNLQYLKKIFQNVL